MAGPHLLLLHPPSQLDFRARPYRHWMLGNTVATSPVFEYYPLGFLTLMEYLERHGRSVRIVNLAVKMTKNRALRTRPRSCASSARSPLALICTGRPTPPARWNWRRYASRCIRRFP